MPARQALRDQRGAQWRPREYEVEPASHGHRRPIAKPEEQKGGHTDARLRKEDAGFFVEALNGFPGPYSSYVYEKIGSEGILKLLNGEDNRAAEFRSAVAYGEPQESIKIFMNKIRGTVTFEKKGTKGFGFDPIFIPNNETRTFAEMSIEEKSDRSHRAGALNKFATWYLRQKTSKSSIA